MHQEEGQIMASSACNSCACADLHGHMRIHTHVYALCRHMHAYMCMYKHIRVYTCTYLWAYTHIYIHLYKYTRVHVYTQTCRCIRRKSGDDRNDFLCTPHITYLHVHTYTYVHTCLYMRSAVYNAARVFVIQFSCL